MSTPMRSINTRGRFPVMWIKVDLSADEIKAVLDAGGFSGKRDERSWDVREADRKVFQELVAAESTCLAARDGVDWPYRGGS
jgi:hypothetical protein